MPPRDESDDRRDDFEQVVTDILFALDDWTDLPDGPSVDDAREAVMRELLSYADHFGADRAPSDEQAADQRIDPEGQEA